MSEIDRPTNHPEPPDAADSAQPPTVSSPAPVWPADPVRPAEAPQAARRSEWQRPDGTAPASLGGVPATPADQTVTDGSARWASPFEQSGAKPDGTTAAPSERSGSEASRGGPASLPAQTTPAGQTSQVPYGQPAGQAPGYAQYPSWTPEPAPRKSSGVVKWVVGSAAAIALALCSGVTGAVVATVMNDNNGGFSLPVSTDTAPIVDRSTLAGVAAEVQPSVVSIATDSGEGSGVILTEDGYIVTNNHVVETAQGGTVTVTFSNGKKARATVVGTDPRTDLAVVKADASGLKAASFGDSGRVNVGDTVLAIGSPLGLQGSVTSGIISAKDRIIGVGQDRSGSLSGLLQTDAPINPGNSGGALVNMAGDVIGINTAIATSGSGEGNIGVGFAIPSIKAKQVAEQLINGQKVSHPFLGVSVTAEPLGGAKIGTISPNSPAAAAGLQVDDVIVKFGERVVNDSDDLVSAVQTGTVGQQVTVEYVRNGENKTATVTLGEAS